MVKVPSLIHRVFLGKVFSLLKLNNVLFVLSMFWFHPLSTLFSLAIYLEHYHLAGQESKFISWKINENKKTEFSLLFEISSLFLFICHRHIKLQDWEYLPLCLDLGYCWAREVSEPWRCFLPWCRLLCPCVWCKCHEIFRKSQPLARRISYSGGCLSMEFRIVRNFA